MSMPKAPSKPRAPSRPKSPSRGTEGRLPPTPQGADVRLQATPVAPPQWPGSDLEWITWSELVRRGHKIYGRPQVQGQTLIHFEADWDWQPALPVAGLNVSGKGFRADFVSTAWGRVPAITNYPRGIVLDPRNNFTHPDPGRDRMHRAILASNGYRLIFLDDGDLRSRPREVIGLALRGIDVSSVR